MADFGEGIAEVGQQIAKLMATLAQAGQVNDPSSAPSSPWEMSHERGCCMIVSMTPPSVNWYPSLWHTLFFPPFNTCGVSVIEDGSMF